MLRLRPRTGSRRAGGSAGRWVPPLWWQLLEVTAGTGAAPAPRAGDRLGSQPRRGVPRCLPSTGSPGFERKPNASSLHTSKGKPPCSSPGSSFSAGSSQSCLCPRHGMGWEGSSPRTHPTKPCCITSRLPCLIKEHLFYFAYILLGQKMRRNNRPRKGSHSETLFHLWEVKDNRTSHPSGEEFNGGAGLRMSPVPQTRARRRKHADSHFPVLPRSSLPLSDQLWRRNLRAWWGFSASNTIPSANPTRATTSACWKAQPTTAWAKVGRTNPKSWPNIIRDL